jgi:hypothetical protein
VVDEPIDHPGKSPLPRSLVLSGLFILKDFQGLNYLGLDTRLSLSTISNAEGIAHASLQSSNLARSLRRIASDSNGGSHIDALERIARDIAECQELINQLQGDRSSGREEAQGSVYHHANHLLTSGLFQQSDSHRRSRRKHREQAPPPSPNAPLSSLQLPLPNVESMEGRIVSQRRSRDRESG